MVEIPFSGFPREAMTVPLVGRRIRFRARYSNLMQVWTIDLSEVIGDATVRLVSGLVVVIGADLLKPYGLELGGLFAVASDQPKQDAKRGELGVRVKLIHYTPDELAAA